MLRKKMMQVEIKQLRKKMKRKNLKKRARLILNSVL